MIEVVRDAADAESVSNDWFRPIGGTSLTVAGERAPKKRAMRFGTTGDVSAFNFAVWTSETLSPVQSRAMSDQETESPLFNLTAEQAEFIRQVHVDIAELDDVARHSSAAKLCLQFAEDVGLLLAHVPSVRWAIFAEEDGSVTLEAHSRKSKRQVSFEFGHDGRSITLISIDEDMHRLCRECGIHHVMTLGDAIAWLSRRS